MNYKICKCGNRFKKYYTIYCSQKCYFKFRVGQKRGKYHYKNGHPSQNHRRDISSLKPDRKGYINYAINKVHYKYHRYVMQQHLGRKLLKEEIVHHIDHNKLNNDISNLCLMTRKEHDKMHAKERTGAGNPMWGKKLTDEQKKFISLSNLGRKMRPETIKKRIKTMRKNGTLKRSEETRRKIGEKQRAYQERKKLK